MTVRCGVLLALCCGLSLAQTQSVTGTVTSTIDSTAIAGARVSLQGGATVSTVLTDAGGAFTFGGVPTGNYSLSAERTGYLAEEQGRGVANAFASVTGQGKPAPVAMRLTPAATIIGSVTDEAGLPLPNASVECVSRTVWNGRGRLSAARQTNANDLGDFRLSAVPAGRYLVCVNVTASSYQRHHRLTYPTDCYPGVADPASAQWVNLSPGEERQLSFRMKPVHGTRISGSVANADKWTSVSVRRMDPPGFPQMLAPPVKWDQKTAAFEILAVSPGDYLITAYSNSGNGQSRRAMRTIQVGSEDIGDIRLALRESSYLSGTVRMGDTPIPADSHLNVRIDGDRRLSLYAFSGGSFRWEITEPGEYSLSVLPQQGWYVQAITHGDTDIVDRKITIDSDAASEPIEIVLAQGGGIVQVSIERDVVQPNVQVKLTLLRHLSTDDGWASQGQPTYTAGAGQLTLTLFGIPSGQYLLFAWPSASEVEYLNPEVIDKYRSFGQSVSVRDGKTTRVTVTPVPIE